MTYRINPASITGTITATGEANALGPYRFRKGTTMTNIVVEVVSTNNTDIISVVGVPPGGDPNDANQLVINFTGITCPSLTQVLQDYNFGGDVDFYVYATTCTGTITVRIFGKKTAYRL